MTDRFTEVTAETKEQTYILTELRETFARISRLLERLESAVGTALERGEFDDVFLLNPCREVVEAVAELRALRQAAKLSGCSHDQIRAVCIAGHVIVSIP